MQITLEAVQAGKADLQEDVLVSEHAASMGGSQVYLAQGEMQTLDTMLKCIAVASGNDASVAVAEHIADDLLRFDRHCGEDKARARKESAAVAKKADWKHFFKYYRKAYEIALKKKDNRLTELQNPRLL